MGDREAGVRQVGWIRVCRCARARRKSFRLLRLGRDRRDLLRGRRRASTTRSRFPRNSKRTSQRPSTSRSTWPAAPLKCAAWNQASGMLDRRQPELRQGGHAPFAARRNRVLPRQPRRWERPDVRDRSRRRSTRGAAWARVRSPGRRSSRSTPRATPPPIGKSCLKAGVAGRTDDHYGFQFRHVRFAILIALRNGCARSDFLRLGFKGSSYGW